MIKRIMYRVREAIWIDPAEHSLKTSTSRRESFSYAIAGCAYMLRHQKNTRILAIATAAVIAVGFWLKIDKIESAILALTVGSVWIAEFVNGAVEASVNLSAATYQPMAKVAKDVAAGAVLIAAAVALVVGVLILAPPLWNQLNALSLPGTS